jgi:hypothetical protein
MKLKEKIDNLSKEIKEIFDEIYRIEFFVFESKDEFFIKKKSDFTRQEILIIHDIFRERTAIFNPHRRKRGEPSRVSLEKENKDPFCNKEETPLDYFNGRLENEKAFSALNIAQAGNFHSLIIFKQHNPFNLEFDDFRSAIDLSFQWFKNVSFKKENLFRFFIWNFHYRAGASISHPHFQIFAFENMPLSLKSLSQKIGSYQRMNYWEALKMLALEIGIDFSSNNLKFFFDLTPTKDAGAIFSFDLENEDSLRDFWKILKSLLSLGIESFNLVYFYDEPFKNLGFFVDRGSLAKLNSDIGSMELFVAPIITLDPVDLSEALRQKLSEG